MKKYRIRIRIPNRMIMWKGKPTRTPVELISTEKELLTVQLFIRSEGITDYDITEIDDFENNSTFNVSEMIGEELIIEEISKKEEKEDDKNDEPKSILDRLLKNESE